MKNKLLPYLPGVLLFFIALAIGMATYQDYGVAWDEPIQRTLATMSYDYIVNANQNLLTDIYRHYGMGFELPLLYVEKWMHITDSRDIYLMRHLVTHIFFLLSALSFYILVFRLFRNKWLACLGFLAIVLAPRIYAHSFFNSKDIPFLSMVIITLTVGQAAFEKNKGMLFLVLGMACGYTASIRVMGIMMAVFLLGFLLIDWVTSLLKKGKMITPMVNLSSYLIGFGVTLYVAWPVLWKHPFHNFMEACQALSHYNNWGGALLFKGKIYPGDKIPWDYFPTWFLISTPLLWLLAGFSGIIWLAVEFFKKPLNFLDNTRERNFTLYVISFFAPGCTVIFLHSVIYDDWRHLYFVYPPFILMALFFINKLLRFKYRSAVWSLSFLQLGCTSYFMVINHPFQQVYFNALVPHKNDYLLKNYDLEYWGCGYKQALEYLIAHDPKPVINITWSMNPVMNNVLILQERDRKRIDMIEHNADYLITSYRLVPYGKFDSLKCVYSISVLGNKILGVYKLP